MVGRLLRPTRVGVSAAALLVAGLVLLGTAATVLLLRPAPVWWASVDVVFVPPERPGNALEGDDDALVPFAAAVEREVVGRPQRVVLASGDARLYAAGVEEGYAVQLARSGGQWQSAFDQPYLSVQVVMPTRAEADRLAEDVLADVQGTADRRQADSGVAPEDRIRTQLSPEHVQTTRVVGSATRSMLGIGVVGAVLAAAVAVGDRSLARRRSRPGA